MESFVSIRVLHVPQSPERRAFLQRLQDQLALDPWPEDRASFRVMEDAIDLNLTTKERSCFPNFRRAMFSHDPQATHVLIMTEDALPARGFVDAALQIADLIPDRVVGMFSGRKVQNEAYERGHYLYRARTGLWGVCMMVPVSMVRPFDAWQRSCIASRYKHDDGRVMHYHLAHQIPIWMTAPSLVEHIGAATSLLGQANRKRTATLYLPDVRGIPWSIPDDPTFDGSLGGYRKEVYYLAKECRTGDYEGM
jgi:hypothetical protein